MAFKAQLLGTAGAAALLVMAAPGAQATKIQVGEIYGSYDAQCGTNIDCSFGHPTYTMTNNGVNAYDTPNLFFVNTSASTSLTNLSITLTGYQADNNGTTKTFSIPDVGPQTVYRLSWLDGYGGTIAGDLFSYDYDDEYGRTNFSNPPNCNSVGQGLCADVGNFDVSLTGLLNGNALDPIASSFSPDNTQGGGNQQGAFVGWEGLDPQGFSESVYDAHSGSTPGVLAYIYSGTSGSQTSVPEPATLSLFGAGLGALAVARRRRKQKA